MKNTHTAHTHFWTDQLALQTIPCRTLGEDNGVTAIMYENVPFHGKPTEVFAYYGIPEIAENVPAIVCIHGGGGKAFDQWVRLWNEKGYAAIAMDLGGCNADKERHENAGPDQDHPAKFATHLPPEDMWTYHAVAACIRAHTILRNMPEVNPDAIGVTGISWGGYLTCILAGVDPRYAFCVPVYGCGYITENGAEGWNTLFVEMTSEDYAQWKKLWDPASYLPYADKPVLFVTGTNDFAYPLDSLKKTYSAIPGDVTLCVRKEMPHGHEAGWAPKEISIFADSYVKNGIPLPRIEEPIVDNNFIKAAYTSGLPLSAAYVLYTNDTGIWEKRQWHEEPANFTDTEVTVELPDDVRCWFLAIEDERDAYVSSEHNCSAS